MVNCMYIMLGNTGGKYVYHYLSIYILKNTDLKSYIELHMFMWKNYKGNQGNDKIQDSSYFWKYDRKYVIKEAHCVS